MSHITNIRHPDFGELLSHFMARGGWTNAALSKETGVDHSLIARYRTLDRCPTRTRAIVLAKALRLDDDDAQRLLLTLGYLSPTYQRRLRASLWSDA